MDFVNPEAVFLKDAFQILQGSRIGLRSQTQVNLVFYPVLSFTNEFDDITVKRPR